MRAFVLTILLSIVVIGSQPLAHAEIDEHTGGTDTGGVVVGGTPIAIAVVAPAGTLASYERKGSGSGARWTCGYYGFESGSSSGISINIDYSSGSVQPNPGQGYAFLCHDQNGELVHSRFLIYDPGDPFAGLFAAERAAELALERLELPDPVVRLNPPGDQLLGLPTWMWVDTPWVALDVSASVTGVTSTVVATPVEVVWNMGDGATVTCAGPGAAYDPARSTTSQASDCSHFYDTPSYALPNGAYDVTATVTYAVSWTATTGAAGDLGSVTRSSTARVPVVEVQAVIN